MKYNDNGTKQWTQQLGASSLYVVPNDYATGVATDSSNNVYVTGYTNGEMDGNTRTGGWDFFLVKYNDNGTKQWTRQLGSSTITGAHTHQWNTYAYGVTVDSSDNIYVTGTTSGGLDGSTISGLDDIFLVKYNSSGIKQLTRHFGTSTSGMEDVKGVTVDSSDNIYLVGNTAGILDDNLNYGHTDIFLVKYNF